MTSDTGNNHRRTAIIVGVLFIIATAFLFIGEAVYKPFLGSPDYLELAYPNRSTVVFGIMLEYICVLAMPLIPAFFFPVLRKHSEALAIAYIIFRSLEGIILIAVAEVGKLSLIGISQDYLANSEADATYFHAIGNAMKSFIAWGDTAGLMYNIVFTLGGFTVYTVLFQSRLIPRWLSGWGLMAIAVLLVGVVLGPFVSIMGSMELFFVLPIAVQEMVMALWLIIRGFNPSAIEPESKPSDVGRGLRMARA